MHLRTFSARMRANYILSMAQLIEETARDSNQTFVASLIRFALFKSAADKLWMPFKLICFSPVISLAVLIVVYILFLVIFLPLFLISFLVTSYGSFLVFILLFHWLAIFIARSIAFPGCNAASLKHASTDIIRRLAEYLENTASATNEIASSLMLVASGKLESADFNTTTYTIDQVWPAVEFFPNMNLHFKDALDTLKRDNALATEEVRNLTRLCASMEEFFGHFSELNRFVVANQSWLNAHKPTSQSSASRTQNYNELLTISSRCLKSSEKVRICAAALRPAGSSDSDDGSNGSSDFNFGQIKQLFAFASGVTGYEKVSFPYMRSILKHKHHAVSLQLHGVNDFILDGILLPCAANIHSTSTSNDDNSGSRLGKKIVFFCGPNAAFYEGIAQYHNFDQSWFGFYLAQGLDVFVFNYRGYGRSKGSPSPSVLKGDAVCLLQQLHRLYSPETVLIHGESIGGMIACHLAAHCPNLIHGLVVDRSFSSLDNTAARLLGNWAGYGLRMGAGWTTLAVPDFLRVQVPKLLMQDPEDEIIADPSSLRAGVARAMFARSSSSSSSSPSTVSGDRPSENLNYAIARYERKPLPLAQVTAANELLSSAMKVSRGELLPWSMPLWEHFYACCRHILEMAAESMLPSLSSSSSSHGNPPSSNRGQQQQQASINNNDPSSPTLQTPLIIGQIEMMQRQGGHASTNQTMRTLVADGLVLEEGEAKDYLEEQQESSSNRKLPLTMLSQQLSSSSSSSSSRNHQEATGHRNRYEQRQQMVQALCRQRYVSKMTSIDMSDSTAHGKPLQVYQKAWIAISRLDNGCGQRLGPAIGGRGLDGVQAWLQSLLIFGHDQLRIDNIHDGSSKVVKEGLERTARDLRRLRQLEPQLNDHEAILFLEKAISLLQAWHEQFCSSANHRSNEVDSDVESSLQSQSSSVRLYGSTAIGGLEALQHHCPQHVLSHCATSSSLPPLGSSCLDHKLMGKLLPLSCGHNGWPSAKELVNLRTWLVSANIASSP